jgi:hypothetical protein
MSSNHGEPFHRKTLVLAKSAGAVFRAEPVVHGVGVFGRHCGALAFAYVGTGACLVGFLGLFGRICVDHGPV